MAGRLHLRGAPRPAPRVRLTRQVWFVLTGLVVIPLLLVVGGCGGSTSTTSGGQEDKLPAVIAAESFLADIAQNVAGSRLTVETLMPRGTDPHTFEPTPGDL